MERKGFLLVLMDPPPAFEEEFNAWYDTEHFPQRMAIPGFESGHRYVSVDGPPRYLAHYDLASPSVLDSQAYLEVSLARSSPWTKRVVGRVRVYRSAGVQVYPGKAVAGTCARILLLRFRALESGAEPTIVAGMRANFEGRPETKQVKVLAFDTGAGVDFLGVVETRAPTAESINPGSFGEFSNALDLMNSYVNY